MTLILSDRQASVTPDDFSEIRWKGHWIWVPEEQAAPGDLMASLTAEYDVPLWSDGRFFYRGYVYLAGNFSVVTKASFLASKEEWSGRTKRPFSFDLGFKVETPVGLFTLSLGYIMDLVF